VCPADECGDRQLQFQLTEIRRLVYASALLVQHWFLQKAAEIWQLILVRSILRGRTAF